MSKKTFRSLKKAREDKKLAPNQRKKYRKERRAMEGRDPLADQMTSAPGVSDRGIEARRADASIPADKPIAHGYARTHSDIPKQKQKAKDYFRSILEAQRSIKPNLDKSDALMAATKKVSAGSPSIVLRGWQARHDKKNGMFHLNHSQFGSVSVKRNPKASSAQEFPYVAVHNGASIGRYASLKHVALGVINYIRDLSPSETRMQNNMSGRAPVLPPTQTPGKVSKDEMLGQPSKPRGSDQINDKWDIDRAKAKDFQAGFNAGGPSLGEMWSNIKNAFGKSESYFKQKLHSLNKSKMKLILKSEDSDKYFRKRMAAFTDMPNHTDIMRNQGANDSCVMDFKESLNLPLENRVRERLGILNKAKQEGKYPKPLADINLQAKLGEDGVKPAEPYKNKLLSDEKSNAKTAKNANATGNQYKSMIMYLAPAGLAGRGNVCPGLSAGCKASCLNTAGMGSMVSEENPVNAVHDARIARTQYIMDHPHEALAQLDKEIDALKRKASKEGQKPVVRLNGTSDLAWETFKHPAWGNQSIMERHPDVQFYDYTARPDRVRDNKHANYHLTFSVK